ncbi:hypothetical protein FA15DRAFT_676058 [Coprinopsis marcescibilis]|uniref:Uncharacterized protein n=1 Tax=Coprinopsis marcescibilis TaxID=230819 RepID=A0A5C3KBY2_COPMA|nr:hypothetical protein FA15DRAFT_676058 [Coprinopsis marcescibilis]
MYTVGSPPELPVPNASVRSPSAWAGSLIFVHLFPLIFYLSTPLKMRFVDAKYKSKAFYHAIYARITLNRFTTLFFCFSLFYCFAQGILQSFLFSVDNEYDALLNAITGQVIPPENITFLTGKPGSLRLEMCRDVPHVLVTGAVQDPYPCETVFESQSIKSPTEGPTRSLLWADGVDVFKSAPLSKLDGVTVTLRPAGQESSDISLSLQCVQNLHHAKERVAESRREELSTVAVHFWLFAVSVIAIVNDSLPHLLTVIITRTLVTGWGSFAVWRSERDTKVFVELLEKPGTPCSLNLFSDYFSKRLTFQIADLALAATALVVFIYLSLVLYRMYSSASFRCVGAPAHINRINKFFLALLSCLQLEVFVVTASMGLWIDVLLNTGLAKITPLMKIYITAFIMTMVSLLPWIAIGWFGAKRERRWYMLTFLIMSFIILFTWLLMFYSIIYRWTFLQWPFLACLTVMSLLLLIANFVLGVICRTQFGKGHREYLLAEEALSALDFTREVFSRDENREKFELPTPSRKNSTASNHSLDKDNEELSTHQIRTLEKGILDPKYGQFQQV